MDQPPVTTSTVRSGDGTTIAFERVGAGAPLVLVVGAFCDRGTLRTLAQMLAEHLTVFTYDRRGRGASSDTPPYAVEREIDDLHAVIGAAGGDALAFGHSSGAVLALEAAAHGEHFNKLAVYEPPYIVDDTRARPVGLAGRVDALITAGRRVDAMRLFLTEGAEVPAAAIDGMAASPDWPAMEAIAHTLPYDLTICGDQMVPLDRLARITVPTLALSGGASPDWARNAVAAVAAAIPGAEHASLDGQTHGAADEVLAPVLSRFFLS